MFYSKQRRNTLSLFSRNDDISFRIDNWFRLFNMLSFCYSRAHEFWHHQVIWFLIGFYCWFFGFEQDIQAFYCFIHRLKQLRQLIHHVLIALRNNELLSLAMVTIKVHISFWVQVLHWTVQPRGRVFELVDLWSHSSWRVLLAQLTWLWRLSETIISIGTPFIFDNRWQNRVYFLFLGCVSHPVVERCWVLYFSFSLLHYFCVFLSSFGHWGLDWFGLGVRESVHAESPSIGFILVHSYSLSLCLIERSA